ncbi:inhibitor of nuclear factor kappa-B kinase subunit beta isoform X2 [Teleopsis dalmanni]|uniref:inhibitor of nuclear factor kappa-B kinase subunit beta isoform X2 n=1 Tax=Teleopsis dalmanni TaxID=139649 RepID=UPI0018CEF033|nr:inhibitor of nuclear factor kappa-B kinase subunit beta isoform X2 [Teleopsis dalmanni]
MNEHRFNDFKDWELIQELGTGGFGAVLHWRNRRTNQEIATKSLKENYMLNQDEIAKINQRWKKEYDWMQNMETESIVGGIVLTDLEFVNYLNTNHLWRPLPVIVMNYCNEGDVRKILEKPENMNGLPEFEIKEILRSLCAAIKYMHTKFEIEHRDLKPDNIVIHQDRVTRKKMYKLTDLGFARKTATSKNTILKSVVGTRHYFAPEILDTKNYTNSVDYWSIGIIAYELMTGSQPFIPHAPLPAIIINVRKKCRDCIAITENVNKSSEYIYETELPKQQFLSSVFKTNMQYWLRLALDISPKTRGFDLNQKSFKFYESIDEIVDSKILTIFYLNECEFLSYCITHENLNENWIKVLEYIAKDTGTAQERLILILPSGHRIAQLTHQTTIGDLFMENWQDTAASNTPPVMLYVVGHKCPFNLSQKYSPSETVLKCVNIKVDNKVKNNKVTIDEWILRDYKREAHFMLTKAQRILEAFANGILECILTIEDVCHNNKASLDNSLQNIIFMKGKIHQFTDVINHMINEKSYNEEFIHKWKLRAEQYNTYMMQIENMTAPLKNQFNVVHSNAKELAKKELCDNLVKKDIYEIKQFERCMTSSTAAEKSVVLEMCTNATYVCFNTYEDGFNNNNELKTYLNNAMDLYEKFTQIRDIEQTSAQHIISLNTNLLKSNEELISDLGKYNQLSNITNQVHSLKIDGAGLQDINSFDSICNISTSELIGNVLSDMVLKVQDLQCQ